MCVCYICPYLDCPEVVALHQYIAQQPDELSMEPGDWIRVLKKMRDGENFFYATP